MIAGARQGTLSGLRRLIAFAMTRDLGVYVIPGPEIAQINGLDIEATGMRIVATPRHATVLLVIGDIPPALCDAATVIYAQMMRPRILFALNKSSESTELSPLPAADIVAGVSQQELIIGVHQLRTALAAGAFQPDVADFDSSVLQIKIEYTCSMHPEIVQDEPGSCPKCGMDLIQRETQASGTHNPKSVDHSVMEHKSVQTPEHASRQPMDHGASVEYTCPMHPEITSADAAATEYHVHRAGGHYAVLTRLRPPAMQVEQYARPAAGEVIDAVGIDVADASRRPTELVSAISVDGEPDPPIEVFRVEVTRKLCKRSACTKKRNQCNLKSWY